MSVPAPTPADIAALAAELGYTAVVDSADGYAGMIAGMLGVYDAVEAVPEQSDPATRTDVEHRTPTADEDPHHAWMVRASVRGAASGPLAGLRLGVKDSIMVAGLPMTNGSDVLTGFVPSQDATVVSRALAAGAEIVGTTTAEYFCMSGGSHTSATGVVHNPHRRGHSAAGSSSGSAVALVTGDADLTLGSDQAGSIRMPASWCGVVGLKPTYGLVPCTGASPLDAVFDHVGPMSRTVVDNARFLQVIAGSDGIDPRQRDVSIGDFLADVDAGVAGVRVGVLREGFGGPEAEPGVEDSVRATAEALRGLGATVEEVSVPLHALAPAVWTAIAIEGMAETVLRNQGFGFGRLDHYPTDLMEHLSTRRDQVANHPANVALFSLVGRWVDRGHGRLHYARAVNRARTVRAAYDAALRDHDVLIMPTTPQTARPLPDPSAGPMAAVQASIEMSSNACPFDITHHPALSVPCGDVDGLPVGLQVVGRHFDEAMIYRVGRAVETTR
jgi:amidase